jgi:hypothetical protein
VAQSALSHLLRRKRARVDYQFVQIRGFETGCYLIAPLQVPFQSRSLARAIASPQSFPDDVGIGGETNHANTALNCSFVTLSISCGTNHPTHNQLAWTHRLIALPDCGNVASLYESIVRTGRRPGTMEPINVHQAEGPTCIRE